VVIIKNIFLLLWLKSSIPWKLKNLERVFLFKYREVIKISNEKEILEGKMNFNFNNHYIEDDSYNLPYELYEINHISKINELSRQLQTFLNYKYATIQYRFRSKNFTPPNDKKYKETKSKYYTLASKFIKLLLKIRGRGVSYEVEIKKMLNQVILKEDKLCLKLLMDLKDVTQNLFTTIHILSEQEIHLHPKFLRFIANLIQDMLTVFKVFNNWASGFYEELRVNYHKLHEELNIIIPEDQVEKKDEKSTSRKQQSLEERLKEW